MRPPNNTVTLMKSIFNKRPPTIYFPYPGFLKMHRSVDGQPNERLIKMK
jgi:hypothetical protein